MPAHEPPDWVVPLWWTADADRTAVSGNQLIRRWYANMSTPKPPVNACVPELAGWSGVLGRKTWVQSEYLPRPAELARGAGFRNKEINEPENWYAVSMLYARYGDPLARFSADFAAVVHDMRPRGLPNDGWVGPLKNRVPPIVRSVMAGAVDGSLGGVADSVDSARRFIDTSDAQLSSYAQVARRGYLSVLLDRLQQLRDADSPDETTMQILEETIAAHAAAYGDPDQPPRKPTDDEKQRVHRLLGAVLEQQPEVTDHPHFGEAYRRAANVMLRWVVEGREEPDARVLFNALRWVKIDEHRKRMKLAEHEILCSDGVPLGAADPLDGVDRRLDADGLLARAHAELASYPEPGVSIGANSWEKSLALRLLSRGNAVVLDAYESLADVIRAAWADALAADRGTPPLAYALDVETAARYTQMLLSMVVSTAARSEGTVAERFARRLDRICAEVAADRARMADCGEPGART